MPRIHPVDYDAASAAQRDAHEEHERDHGRMTNMKRTLLHSLPSFHALMEWYTLRDTVRPFLGDRGATVFSHAISAESDCLICSTFFRRILIDAGEDPDELALDEREQLLVDFGRQLAKNSKGVDDVLYGRLTGAFAPDQIVALTAFGAIMLATNIFNDALRVDLDGHLEPYRRLPVARARSD
ncbi:MAG: carboxymuconolactone decarboxylase family protein [Gemmatimonadaceae bacterium]